MNLGSTTDLQASWRQEGFEVLDTEELAAALAEGKTVTLPSVSLGDLDLTWLDDADAGRACDDGRTIISVEEIGEEEEDVQCIMIDDPDHLYLTDGLIPTHNTANIVFLKSTDDAMIETLSKMSGKTHESRTNQKTVTRNATAIANKNQDVISYNSSTQERPVISYNDLAFMPMRNSIVFVAGGIGDKTSASVVWNRNETALPMSWRLLWVNPIKKPGTNYSLQTIPTLSSAIDFDVRANQPNFSDMILTRMEQAIYVTQARSDFKDAFGYTDDDIARLDQDVVADEIMDIVMARIERDHAMGKYLHVDGLTPSDAAMARAAQGSADSIGTVEENEELTKSEEVRKAQAEYAAREKPIYAGGTISKNDLVPMSGSPTHSLDNDIVRAYRETRAYFERDKEHFIVKPDGLYKRDGTPLIETVDQSSDLKAFQAAAQDTASRVYDDDGLDAQPDNTQRVTDDMYIFLSDLPMWSFAQGRFETAMAKLIDDGWRHDGRRR